MDTINTISTLVGSLGFPIAACVFMAYYVSNQTKQHSADNKVMTEAINEMRIAIVKLTEKIDRD